MMVGISCLTQKISYILSANQIDRFLRAVCLPHD